MRERTRALIRALREYENTWYRLGHNEVDLAPATVRALWGQSSKPCQLRSVRVCGIGGHRRANRKGFPQHCHGQRNSAPRVGGWVVPIDGKAIHAPSRGSLFYSPLCEARYSSANLSVSRLIQAARESPCALATFSTRISTMTTEFNISLLACILTLVSWICG